MVLEWTHMRFTTGPNILLFYWDLKFLFLFKISERKTLRDIYQTTKLWRHWSVTFPNNWRRRKRPRPWTGSDHHRWRSDRKLCRELRRLEWLRRPTNGSPRANKTLYTWELLSKKWRLAYLLHTCLSRLTLLWSIPQLRSKNELMF